MDHLATTINDWVFAVATASVPILTFVVSMYLLMKIHFLSEAVEKIEHAQIHQARELVELAKAVAALQASSPSNERR